MYVNLDAGRQLVNDWNDQDQREINNKRNAVLDSQNAERFERQKKLWARDDQQYDDFQSSRKNLADQLNQGFGLGPDVSQNFSSQTPIGAQPAQPRVAENEPTPEPDSAEDFRRQAEGTGQSGSAGQPSGQGETDRLPDQGSVTGPANTDANGVLSAGGGRGFANPAPVSTTPSAATPSVQPSAQKPTTRTITPGSAEDFEAQVNAAARTPGAANSMPGAVPKPSGTVPIMPNGQSYAAQAMANLAARARTAKSPDELNEIRQEALKLKIGQDAATIYDHILKASPAEMAEISKSVSDSPVNSYSMKFNPATNMTELSKDGHAAEYTRTDLAKILAARYRLQAGDASGLADIAAVDAGLAARVKEDLGMQESAAKINTQTASERDRSEYYRGQNAARMASANNKAANFTSKEWYELSNPKPDLISIPDPTNSKGVSTSGALHSVWDDEYNSAKQSGTMDPYQAAANANKVTQAAKEKAKQIYDATLAADKKSTVTMEDVIRKVYTDISAARQAAAKQAQQGQRQAQTQASVYSGSPSTSQPAPLKLGPNGKPLLMQPGDSDQVAIFRSELSKAQSQIDSTSPGTPERQRAEQDLLAVQSEMQKLGISQSAVQQAPASQAPQQANKPATQAPANQTPQQAQQPAAQSPADRIKTAGQGLQKPTPKTADEAQFANVASKNGWEYYGDDYGFPAKTVYRKKDANGFWVTKTGTDLAKDLGVLY